MPEIVHSTWSEEDENKNVKGTKKMHQVIAKAEAENYIAKHHVTYDDNVPEIVHSTWS